MTVYLKRKQCGNCGFWNRDVGDDEFKLCDWKSPELPFWASIDEGSDHNNYTRETDGRGCRTWKPSN